MCSHFQKLLETFSHIKSVKVHRAAIWILGEYASTSSDIEVVMKQIVSNLGEGALVDLEQKLISGEEEAQVNSSAPQTQQTTLVTSDGTYATQSIFSTAQ